MDDDLYVKLAKRVSVGASLWVTSDSCHSGTVLDLRFVLADNSNVNTAKTFLASTICENVMYEKCVGNVYLLSGCHDVDYAADVYEADKYQGALSWAFFQCLCAYPSSTLNELLKHICAKLKERAYVQIPQLSMGCCPDVSISFRGALRL